MARARRATTLAFRRDADSKAPVYGQLATFIEDAISDGRIALGARLPSERKLATDLGLSRTTVTLAYRELEARGLVRGRVGHGTVVIAADSGQSGDPVGATRVTGRGACRHQLPSAPDIGPELISFADGWAHPSLYPKAELEDICRAISADLADAALARPARGIAGAAIGIGDVATDQGHCGRRRRRDDHRRRPTRLEPDCAHPARAG